MSSIFLSHNSKDKKFVRDLANKLKNHNVRVWLDEAEIKIGDSLLKKIEEGIDDMEFLGVVLSPNSIDSEWVNKEVEMAMNGEIKGKKIKVLPIKLKNCSFPGFLRGKRFADFSTKKKFEESFESILETIGADKNDKYRVNGERCILEKDFKQIIINYFSPKKVEINYFDDYSGINFIKVDLDNTFFQYYSYWTKPSINDLLSKIFNKKINDIEIIDENIYKNQDKDKITKLLIEEHRLPKDSFPGMWSDLGDIGKNALNEYDDWLNSGRVIALLIDEK